MSLAAGEVFAGYAVVCLLGSDDLGEVYLARHPRQPGQETLRVLPAWLSADGEFRARFEHDADLAATLRHPNIVGVHGHGEHLGRLWLATDYVDGVDAATSMRARYPNGMPAADVVDVVGAIADALDYARESGVAHHGVTAANILLTPVPGRRILLTDIGIPRRAAESDDQFTLAATAHHLLCGVPRLTHPLGQTRPDLAAFDPALARALGTGPSVRFDTCLDFAGALRDGLVGAAPTAASPILRNDPPTSRFDGAETGPKQPVFAAAWSEEPAPNPYLEPYPDDPYPDPDPAHSPTMTAMPTPEAPPPEPPAPVQSHTEHPTGRIGWAIAAVAAVVVLVIGLLALLARGGSDGEAQPSTRPQSSPDGQPPAAPETSSSPAPSPAPSTLPDDGTGRRRVKPPPVSGADGMGESCVDGYQITGQDGWASQGVRGNPAATCVFAGNVLKAYWDAADPDDAPRDLVVAGAIPCSDGAQCAGDAFVVTCGVEGADPWVTCRGGSDAVVYLY